MRLQRQRLQHTGGWGILDWSRNAKQIIRRSSCHNDYTKEHTVAWAYKEVEVEQIKTSLTPHLENCGHRVPPHLQSTPDKRSVEFIAIIIHLDKEESEVQQP